MKYTQIPVETFNQLQINAGMLLNKFDPATPPAEEDKLGATTGGFKLQSTDKKKGQFAFEFTGHYSMKAQDVVPYEIAIVSKTEEEEP